MSIAYGSNIKHVDHIRGMQRVFRTLGFKGAGPGANKPRVCSKAGVPASNTAADDPGQAPAFIIDTTNSDVYFCHTRVSSSSFTVVKVSA